MTDKQYNDLCNIITRFFTITIIYIGVMSILIVEILRK